MGDFWVIVILYVVVPIMFWRLIVWRIKEDKKDKMESQDRLAKKIAEEMRKNLRP